jgi:hypothetical protein
MTDTSRGTPPHPLPASFGPRYGAIVWVGMVMMAALGCIPLWVAWHQLTRGMVDLSEGTSAGFILVTGMGLFLLVFPALFIWSLLKGLPRLDIGKGWLRYVSMFGRVTVLELDHYAKAVLGENALARGYDPRVELYPTSPGDKTRMIPLRPHLATRAEAEAMIALIHCAAGPRPNLSTEQTQEAVRNKRRDYMILAGIVIVSAVLLILLRSAQP